MQSLEAQKICTMDKLKYNSKAIGNGSAMRSGCIGLFYPGKAIDVNCLNLLQNVVVSS